MKKAILFLMSLFCVNGTIFSQDQIFLSSGEYTVPSGVSQVLIEVLGAGGNGVYYGLSGGGGGGYASGIYHVTPGQVLTVQVAESGSEAITKVDELIQATSGENALFYRDAGGYSFVGVGGIGSGGTISNHKGGDGGKGYYTNVGGGGGGAAGRNGNGSNGGDTLPYYVTNDCPHTGGVGGVSGGFPGGDGGKGAGFANCDFSDILSSTPAGDYGAGGGGGRRGGNGTGFTPSVGADGFVRISTTLLQMGITHMGFTLYANESNATYQWINSNSEPIAGAVNQKYEVKEPGSYAVIVSDGTATVTTDFMEITFADFTTNSELFSAYNYKRSSSFTHHNKFVNDVFIEVVGSGGNGGNNGLSGGGGGGYASGIYTLAPDEMLTVQVAESGSEGITKVGDLLQATGGGNALFTRDVDGYGLEGAGGIGSGGTISNDKGGDGGKGYYTYFGGGGGGAAGRKGTGSDGGDTWPYDPNGCPHTGGEGGLSGGFPGGDGGKGAGYANCDFSDILPSTATGDYGAGGGGGNGNGSAPSVGADGLARISYCLFYMDITSDHDVLTFNNPSSLSYQWIQINDNNTIDFLNGETNTTFHIPSSGGKYALYATDGVCSMVSEVFTKDIATKLDKAFADREISVYPNPASDVVFVSSEYKVNLIQMYTMSSQLVKQVKNNNAIDVNDILAGMYLLKINTSNGQYVQQIIVE